MEHKINIKLINAYLLITEGTVLSNNLDLCLLFYADVLIRGNGFITHANWLLRQDSCPDG